MKKYKEFILNEKLRVEPVEFKDIKFKIGDSVTRIDDDEEVYKIINIVKYLANGEYYYMLYGTGGHFTPYEILTNTTMLKEFVIYSDDCDKDILCKWSAKNGDDLESIEPEDQYEDWD